MSISEAMLRKGTLIFFLITFIGIWIADFYHLERPIPIGNLSSKDLNTRVSIKANISHQEVFADSVLSMTISDTTGSIKAVIFDFNSTLNYQIPYTFEGRLTLYEGEQELIVSKATPMP